MDLFSVICVSNLSEALPWYEALLGRRVDEVMGKEHLWQLSANAWVVIDERPAKAGGAVLTLGVDNLGEILDRLAAEGFGHEPVEIYPNGVRHVDVLDPDGNSVSLAEAPAA